jgi:hypothetical protein
MKLHFNADNGLLYSGCCWCVGSASTHSSHASTHFVAATQLLPFPIYMVDIQLQPLRCSTAAAPAVHTVQPCCNWCHLNWLHQLLTLWRACWLLLQLQL